MAKTPEVAAELPPLPPTSIDFDALQEALRVGKSGEEAIAAASPGEPAAPVNAPETTPVGDPPVEGEA